MWNMGIMNSYTLEATFAGSILNGKSIHFNTRDLESMGYHFCDTLLDYCDPDQSKVIIIFFNRKVLKNLYIRCIPVLLFLK